MDESTSPAPQLPPEASDDGFAFSLRALREAWADVLANDLEDGVPAPGVVRFADDEPAQLSRLHRQLAEGTYVPQPLTELAIPKDGDSGAVRKLQIPAVRDRVVSRATLAAIGPRADRHLGPAAFAYRPGLGVVDAVDMVVSLRESGCGWVLRTDVDDCFPTIPVELARRRLGALVDDSAVLRVVDALLARRVIAAGLRGPRPLRGLAQGCALSPVLSNLVLIDLDEALLDAGFPVVRYGDDVVVAARSEADAWEAARVATTAVEELGMTLGADKTCVMSFADGFTFIGEDFGPRYPPSLSEARIEEPERKVVYAASQGSGLRVSKGRLLVESANDEELLSVPVSQVGRVVLFGGVGLSAGVRAWAASNDVDVVFGSRAGAYQSSLVAAGGGSRVSRLRRQVAMSGSPEALPIAKAIVEAKISHQIVVLRRFNDPDAADETREAVATMRGMVRLVPDCATRDELMGVEGAAAAAYFPALGRLLPEGMRFVTRSRQPPMDVVNSGLSFLYTVLLGECVTALYAAGLEPALGLLHSDKDDRPSLALDLQEEFRPLIVDQVVAEAVRQGRLAVEHGRSESGRSGVYLTKAGRQVLLDGYERRMLRSTRGALPEFAGSWRRHLYRQAQRLRAAIMDPGVEWSGLSWRP